MRRVWTTVAAVWATLAIVAALAWTRQPPAQPLAAPAAATLLVKGPHGTQRLVVVGTVGAPATHATTQTSPPPR